MKLWEVTNGYVGESYTHVLVVAETDTDALAAAARVLKAEADDRRERLGKRNTYDERYWRDLECTLLWDGTAVPWASEVRP